MRKWVIAIAIAASAWGVWALNEMRQEEKAEALAAVMAVAVAPSDKVAEWYVYIQECLESQIRSTGKGRLAIADPFTGGATLVESRPWYVGCHPYFGVNVRFGDGELAPEVVVGGVLRMNGTEPDLGLHPRSVAFSNLLDEMCRFVDDWLIKKVGQ